MMVDHDDDHGDDHDDQPWWHLKMDLDPSRMVKDQQDRDRMDGYSSPNILWVAEDRKKRLR